MGVHNLWQLLLPVGRRVNVESLERKTLAVDVSIWLTQFIKAMRDDEGKVVKNAHLIGTFRRIVKLLYYKIKPIFVFDGGTPALKRRTVNARKRRRDEQERSIAKTAQRLLLAQLKKHHMLTKKGPAKKKKRKRLKKSASSDKEEGKEGEGDESEEGEGLEAEEQEDEEDMEGEEEEIEVEGYAAGFNPGGQSSASKEPPPPSSAAAVAAADGVSCGDGDGAAAAPAAGGGEGGGGGALIGRPPKELPTAKRITAAAAAAALAPRLRLDDDDDDDHKEEEDDDDIEWEEAEGDVSKVVGRRSASAAFAQALSEPSSDIDLEEEGNESGNEADDILLEDENVDVTVLASLPPELQKDVVESAKRRQRMNSRQEYMPVAGNPALYSQAQIQNFLKSSALNQKVMSLKDMVGGDDNASMTGERIASDASRKFIILKDKKPEKAAADKEGGGKDDEKKKRRRKIVDGDEEEEKEDDYAGGGGFVPGTSLETVDKSLPGDDDGDALPVQSEQNDDDIYGMAGGFFPEPEPDDAADDANFDAAAADTGGGGFFPEEEDDDDDMTEEKRADAKPSTDHGAGIVETKKSGPPKPYVPPAAAASSAAIAAIKVKGDQAVLSPPIIAEEKGGSREMEEEEDRALALALQMSVEEPEKKKAKLSEVVEIDDDEEEMPQNDHKKMPAAATVKTVDEANEAQDLVLDLSEAPVTNDDMSVLGDFLAALAPDTTRGNSGGRRRGGGGARSERVSGAAGRSTTERGRKSLSRGSSVGHGAAVERSSSASSIRQQGSGKVVVPAGLAYEKAIETASRLTTWAGVAVRRAIEQHKQEGGSAAATMPFITVPQGILPDSPLDSEKEEEEEEEVEWEKESDDGDFEDGLGDVQVVHVESRVVGDSIGPRIEEINGSLGSAQNGHALYPSKPFQVEGAGLSSYKLPDVSKKSQEGNHEELMAEKGSLKKVELAAEKKQKDEEPPITSQAGVGFAAVTLSQVSKGREGGEKATSPSASMTKQHVSMSLASPEASKKDAEAAIVDLTEVGPAAASSAAAMEIERVDKLQEEEEVDWEEEEEEVIAEEPNTLKEKTGDVVQAVEPPPTEQQQQQQQEEDEVEFVRTTTTSPSMPFGATGRGGSTGSEASGLGEASPLATTVDIAAATAATAAAAAAAARARDMELVNELEDESVLRTRLRNQMRDAEAVTEEMRAEVMELLEMFGVPYLVAPMEAEAQCAALELLGLVDGIVSDDSDSFLFGSRAVYKNIFDERKYVETYKSEDIERELGFRRVDLVSLAMLLGSDYTEGVRGVGIVNATEIIRAFPALDEGCPEGGLQRFREWLDGFDPVKDLSLPGAKEKAEADKEKGVLDTKVEEFHRKHKNARNRWIVDDQFPDPAIFKAYLQPQVNDSTEQFPWSMPDLDQIRLFAGKKLGWPVSDTDGHLLPMIRRMQEKLVQTRLDSYYLSYEDNAKFAKIKSDRLRKAVSQLKNQGDDKDEEDEEAKPKKRQEKKRQQKKKGKAGNGRRTKKAARENSEEEEESSSSESEGGAEAAEKGQEDKEEESEEEIVVVRSRKRKSHASSGGTQQPDEGAVEVDEA